MRARITSILLSAALLSLCSCSFKEDFPIIPEKDSNSILLDEGVPAKLDLIVVEPDAIGIEQGVNTKAAATTMEKTVSNLWIFQFDGTANNSQLLSRQYLANAESIRTVYITPNDNTNRIVIFANVSYRTDLVALVEKGGANPATYSSLMAMSFDTGEMLSNITSLEGALPMCGQLIIPSPDARETTNITIKLTRTVAKISMNLTSGISGYALDSAFVCNVPSQTYYYPDTLLTSSSTTQYPVSTVSRVNYYANTQHRKSISGIGATSTEVYFYVPINIQGTVDACNAETKRRGNAPSNATFVTLRAKANSGDLQKNGGLIYYHKYIGANQTTNFNILPNHCYTYNYNLVGTNIGTNTNIEKSEICNCYTVAPSSGAATITIDAAEMVNRYWKQESEKIHPNDTDITMDIVWSEAISGSSGTASDFNSSIGINKTGTSTFNVTIASGAYGNAIVAVKKGGVTRWSYHIWSSNADPLSEQLTMSNITPSPIILRRNLGAMEDPNSSSEWLWGISYKLFSSGQQQEGTLVQSTTRTFGLYYQWGRKDPFRTFTNATTTSTSTLDYSVNNPDKFFTSSGNWNSNSHQWLDNDGNKTIHDPCPKGWRVSDYSTWDNISDHTTSTYTYNFLGDHTMSAAVILFQNASSVNYETMNYLPIPGYLTPNGTITNVSYRDDFNRGGYFLFWDVSEVPIGEGIYWSNLSSGDNGNCVYIDFNSEKPGAATNTIGLTAKSKSTGANIRCQKM